MLKSETINYNDYILLMNTYDNIIEGKRNNVDNYIEDDILNSLKETNKAYRNIKERLKMCRFKIELPNRTCEKIKQLCNNIHRFAGTRKVNNSISIIYIETDNSIGFKNQLSKINSKLLKELIEL